MSSSKETILQAGEKYQVILDKLKEQRSEYSRFVSQIGVLESRVLDMGMDPAIAMPKNPPLKEYTSKIAENLLTLAESLVKSDKRIPVPIYRDELGSYPLAVKGDDNFSPERFAKEINEAIHGENGHKNQRDQVLRILEKSIATDIQSGTTPKLRDIGSTKTEEYRVLDGVGSMKLFEVVSAISTILESSNPEDLDIAGIDRWLEHVNENGRVFVGERPEIGDGAYSINLSLKGKILYVRPSKAVNSKILEYLD